MRTVVLTDEQYAVLVHAIASTEDHYRVLALDSPDFADYYKSKRIECQQLLAEIVGNSTNDSERTENHHAN